MRSSLETDFEPIPDLSDPPVSSSSHELPTLKPTSEPFETYSNFESTCLTLSQFRHPDIDHLYSSNKGWEWKEHATSPNHGYLFRRVSRSIRASPTEEDENRRGNRTKSTEEEEEDADEDEEEDEESLETVGDPSQMAASQDNVRGKHESMIIIKVEMSIVYSRTYRIPMLCFQAYDQAGSPIRLSTLLSTGIINAPKSTSQRPDAILIPDSPFPLIQLTEHPTTGHIVWSIHPCQVSDAVEELVLASQQQQEGTAGDHVEQAIEVRRLLWLEKWLLLSGGIVDLSYP